MKNYHTLFKFLNLNLTDSEILNDKISKRIDFEIDWIKNPFIYKEKLEAWFIAPNTFENFPKEGYETEVQAEIALAIWKSNKNYDYKELYQLSKFIVNGIKEI